MLTIETHDRVAVLNIDDGKANVVYDRRNHLRNAAMDLAVA